MIYYYLYQSKLFIIFFERINVITIMKWNDILKNIVGCKYKFVKTLELVASLKLNFCACWMDIRSAKRKMFLSSGESLLSQTREEKFFLAI